MIYFDHVKQIISPSMLRRLLSIALFSVLLSSCGNRVSKDNPSKNEESGITTIVEFDSLIANPDSYVGKTISIEGKVVHVCTETGKKMFITGHNPDVRLYVAAGDKISKFPMELLGSEITVEGLITRVSGTANSETEMKEGGMKEMHQGQNHAESMSQDSCETEKAVSGQLSLTDIRMEYKSHAVK